ncbi:heme-binding protein [Mycobacteroides saopaulense]|uniref:heme-binding protein n=1 Tax=Mycobacteroides saopaulense TaxID=1578165 RepID=UPI0009F2F715|nr:heme-binding protein [Mycobacteroides saopaulense]
MVVGGVFLCNIAHADPAAEPPNCSAADLTGIVAGVSASESVYLHTHPEVNEFLSGLKGKNAKAIRADLREYMASHPDVKQDLQDIRRPLTDFKSRCSVPSVEAIGESE